MTYDEIIFMAKKSGVPDENILPNMDILLDFAKLVEQRKCAELADKIAEMPFGDTAASFAVWIREQA